MPPAVPDGYIEDNEQNIDIHVQHHGVVPQQIQVIQRRQILCISAIAIGSSLILAILLCCIVQQSRIYFMDNSIVIRKRRSEVCIELHRKHRLVTGDIIYLPNPRAPDNLFEIALLWLNSGSQPMHVGIYLGNCQVGHFMGDNKMKGRQRYGTIKIDEFEDLLKLRNFSKDDLQTNIYTDYISSHSLRRRPTSCIISDIKQLQGYKDVYDVLDNNCEHFVYRMVYNRSVSPQVEGLPLLWLMRLSKFTLPLIKDSIDVSIETMQFVS